jgi:hypothetical protein
VDPAGRAGFTQVTLPPPGQLFATPPLFAAACPPASHVLLVTNYGGVMRSYRERLSVPVSSWILGELSALIFASTAWAGFGMIVVIASYVLFCGGCAALLLSWGRATIEVFDGELRAGSVTLPLATAGQVGALDEAQTRALRGPRADPSAYMLIRPYLKRAVYIEISGEHQQRPYWLLCTRRPADLAAAIERSRPQARTGGTAVG